MLWSIQRGAAKVHVLGFATAPDRSWFTPKIRAAFEASDELWLEVAPPPEGVSGPPPPSPLAAQHGFDQTRNLFDTLDPQLSKRAQQAAERYGADRSRLEHARPWIAYFILNSAYIGYRNRTGSATVEEYGDEVLTMLARQDGKPIRAEFETGDGIMGFFASMSERQQAERLRMLLDFMDDDETENQSDLYGWTEGRPSEKYIERMRLTTPALYLDEHVRRNLDWASRIAQMLLRDGTYFVALGMNHTVGPDSVQVALTRLGHDIRLTD